MKKTTLLLLFGFLLSFGRSQTRPIVFGPMTANFQSQLDSLKSMVIRNNDSLTKVKDSVAVIKTAAVYKGTATITIQTLKFDYTVNHTLGFTPLVLITPKNAWSAGAYVTDESPTSFRVWFTSLPIVGSYIVNWIALKPPI